MPLGIRPTDAVDTPTLICDQCGKPIEDGRDGNCQWKTLADGGASDRLVFFLHRQCRPDFEGRHTGDFGWATMGLQSLPVRLGDGLHLDWDDAMEAVRRVAAR